MSYSLSVIKSELYIENYESLDILNRNVYKQYIKAYVNNIYRHLK